MILPVMGTKLKIGSSNKSCINIPSLLTLQIIEIDDFRDYALDNGFPLNRSLKEGIILPGIVVPFLRNFILGKDSFHGARRDTLLAIDAFCRIDVI